MQDSLARLETGLSEYRAPDARDVCLEDAFIATSALQKALRRGDRGYALTAARVLLRLDPAKLWRRLAIVTFEDFGLCSPELAGQIIAAVSDSGWRARHGDWAVCSYLVDQLLYEVRDRAIDNCYMQAVALAKRGGTAEFASRLSMTPGITKLLEYAVRLVGECERTVTPRQFRVVVTSDCDSALERMRQIGWVGAPQAQLLKQAFRKSRCLLPVLAPLLQNATAPFASEVQVVVHEPPETRDIAGLPGYCLDGYTRLGRRALAILYQRLPKLARILQGLPTSSQRINAMVDLLFAAEGGICTAEISDPLRDELRRFAMGCWSGLGEPCLTEAIHMMREAIPQLNEIRLALAPEISQPRQKELWSAY